MHTCLWDVILYISFQPNILKRYTCTCVKLHFYIVKTFQENVNLDYFFNKRANANIAVKSERNDLKIEHTIVIL